MYLAEQITSLFLLALPTACIACTVTHEEIFRESREYCIHKSKTSATLVERKFFYLFTCEYCFSHNVALFFILLTLYHLLFTDWRGYLFAGFALVWITNVYRSLFRFIRVGMKHEKIDADIQEVKLKVLKEESQNKL